MHGDAPFCAPCSTGGHPVPQARGKYLACGFGTVRVCHLQCGVLLKAKARGALSRRSKPGNAAFEFLIMG